MEIGCSKGFWKGIIGMNGPAGLIESGGQVHRRPWSTDIDLQVVAGHHNVCQSGVAGHHNLKEYYYFFSANLLSFLHYIVFSFHNRIWLLMTCAV